MCQLLVDDVLRLRSKAVDDWSTDLKPAVLET
jgi:hypothetical protein